MGMLVRQSNEELPETNKISFLKDVNANIFCL